MQPFRPAFARFAILCAALLIASPTLAATFYWVGPADGDWHDPANWASEPDGPGGAGVPTTLNHWARLTAPINLDEPALGPLGAMVIESEAVLQPGTLVTQSLYVEELTGRAEWLGGNLDVSQHLAVMEGGWFEQSGGTIDAARLEIRRLSNDPPSAYLLRDGSLTATKVDIGSSYSQTGGSAAFGLVGIRADASLTWTGGTFATDNLQVEGELVAPSSATTIQIPGLVDLRAPAAIDAANLTIETSETGLVLLPAAGEMTAQFPVVTGAGRVHRAGTTLVVAEEETLRLSGRLLGQGVDLHGRLEAGSADLTLYEVTTRENSSLVGASVRTYGPGGVHFSGGAHDLATITVVGSSAAPVVQSAGDVRASRITLTGSFFAEEQTPYRMQGGTVEADELWTDGWGEAPVQWVQTGGEAVFGGIRRDFGSVPLRIELGGGQFRAPTLVLGKSPLVGEVGDTLAITDPTAEMVIGGGDSHSVANNALVFTEHSELEAVPGSRILLLDADLTFSSSIPSDLRDLVNVTFAFEINHAVREGRGRRGTSWRVIRIAGMDRGATEAGFDENFALGGLEILPTEHGLELEESSDSAGDAALYVDTLILHAGSILNLNGYNLYYRHLIDEGGTVKGGTITLVPEPGGVGVLALGALGVWWRRRRRG